MLFFCVTKYPENGGNFSFSRTKIDSLWGSTHILHREYERKMGMENARENGWQEGITQTGKA